MNIWMKLAAVVATAAVALTAAVAATAGEPGPTPRQPILYKAKADLNGRSEPRLDATLSHVNLVRKGQRVRVKCQAYGGRAYGSKIWDLVRKGKIWAFVPDRYIKTFTDGRAPGIRKCNGKDKRLALFPKL